MKTQTRGAAIATALLALLASPPAAAVNKCTGPTGSITFQDAPCANESKTSEKVKTWSTGPAPQPGQPTETQRLTAATNRSQAARRLIELDHLVLPRATKTLQNHQTYCRQQRAALEQSQYAYKQNLYGKTHAAQVASELVQLTMDCERKEKLHAAALQAVQQERSAVAAAAGN